MAVMEHVTHICHIACIKLRNTNKRIAVGEHRTHTRYILRIQLRNRNKRIAAVEHRTHTRLRTCVNLRKIHNPILVGGNIICCQNSIESLVILADLVVLVILCVPIDTVCLVVCDVLVSPTDGSQSFGICVTCPSTTRRTTSY